MRLHLLLALVALLTNLAASKEKDQESPGSVERLIPLGHHDPGPNKPWTGYRAQKKSKQKVIYNQKTVAVIERAKKELVNCELLHGESEEDRNVTLASLKDIKRKSVTDFQSMLQLMEECRKLPTPAEFQKHISASVDDEPTAEVLNLKIVFPGTKWCGPGNTAETYYDLGKKDKIDACCRNHDNCPVNIGGFTRQYNVTNSSFATVTACSCDEAFYNCLKDTQDLVADGIGEIFFNIVDENCLHVVDDENGMKKLEITTDSLHYAVKSNNEAATS